MSNDSSKQVHYISVESMLSIVICIFSIGVGVLGIDEKVLRSSTFQRVYAYLSRYSTGKPLDKFIYHKGSLEVNTTDFIRLILE